MMQTDLSYTKEAHRRWYRLDNAAKLFPAIRSARLTTFFRISVTLHETVLPDILEKALLRVINRFPYYRVRLRRGFFWYYMEHNHHQPVTEPDQHYPCMLSEKEKNHQYLFRVRYFAKRIAVEFCHVLTDGTGGMIFLKTLLAEYFRLKGEDIPATEGILSLDEFCTEEEEDAYNRFYKPGIHPDKLSTAYHIQGQFEPPGVYRIITGIIPLQEIMAEAKSRSVTLTELLVSVYIDALQTLQEKQVKPKKFKAIRISVPINLRKIFPSKTMRNFSLFTIPGIDPRLGQYDFAEICRTIHYQMKAEINEKSISRQISRNVGGEKNGLVRIIPLVVKKIFANLLYTKFGESLYSGSLSNLGPVSFPPELAKYVERVELIPGPNPINRSGCAVVSYDDFLYISFGRIIKESELERLFFTKLIKMGISVRIESNQ